MKLLKPDSRFSSPGTRFLKLAATLMLFLKDKLELRREWRRCPKGT
jgi:hypothetical protein